MASYPQEVIQTEEEHVSKRLPLGLFAAAFVFFVIGGALLGAWTSSGTDCNSSVDAFGTEDTLCSGGDSGLFYGGIACLVIGAIFKIFFWFSMIAYCAKRRQTRQTIIYVTNPAQPKYGV